MSGTVNAPGGLTPAGFEAMASEAGGWLWGTVQGAFNHKASMSQIIVDAVIGMIPLVGDVTAARDIIAVSIRLIDDPKARESKLEWVLLVVLVLALIPVFGGVVKGVGRLVIKAAGEAGHLAGVARALKLSESAKDIVAFLNRIGAGHAEQWLLRLKFADHQAAILTHFDNFIYTVNGALNQIERRLGRVLSEGLNQRIQGLITGLGQIKIKAREMIPQAVKELDQTLREIQLFVRSGGQTTSRVAEHTVVAGDRAAITMTDELRLTEGMSATRSARGGIEKNEGKLALVIKQGFYKYEPGYPNLTAYAPYGRAEQITTFGGKIVNRPLATGEEIYRVFGPEGVTHGAEVGRSYGPGAVSDRANFWGLGTPPKTAEEWRKSASVLDEWNHDSFIVQGTVREPNVIKACTGKIAEQTGDKIPGQYLPGGGKQAMLQLSAETNDALRAAGERVLNSGKPESFVLNGVSWTVKPTGWKDANGIHGYDLVTLTAGIQTSRLSAREEATKGDRETRPSSGLKK